MLLPSVYIADYQCLSPAGEGVAVLMRSLLEGRTYLREGLGSLPPELAQRIEGLRNEKSLKDQDKVALMGVYLARRFTSIGGGAGVIAGSSRGATATLEASIGNFRDGQRLRAFTSPVTTGSGLSAAIARELRLSGPSFYLSAACSTGLYALIQGTVSIQSGLADECLVGGVEAANTAFTREMMAATKVLSQHTDDFPCKPGADDRSGMVLSEGAALLHLTRDEAGAKAQIIGQAAATEVGTLTGVSADGEALQKAVARALSQAGLKPGDIDIIVGHGAGTVKGDQAELQAYEALFGAELPPLVFHKWCGGHMLGASAALSVILAIEHLKISETTPHPYLPANHPRRERLRLGRNRHALVTSMGFGGSACAVIVKNLIPLPDLGA